jgi:hypothetical protein
VEVHAFSDLGTASRLVWMRGMPQRTLAASVKKWSPLIDELASGYICSVLPVGQVAQAFAAAATKKSLMKVVIRLG